jgi:RNA polymerase sigma-70 factor (ECF subfamily)
MKPDVLRDATDRMDPRDLMGRYCDGDAAAFRQLYALLAPRVRGLLLKLSRNLAVADDLLQITFLKVHRARAAYIRGADPLPWMMMIARRSFRDHVRKHCRELALRDADDIEAEHDAAEHRGVQPLVRAALEKLPQLLRDAVLMTRLEGKSMAEAARSAGTSVAAMKVRAHRGRIALRALLCPPTGALAD